MIEAVPENLDLKLSIMKSLDQIVSPDTILASNTSAIPIAQLGGAVSNPERVVGLHFFSPVPAMKLVEIVRALDTSDETVAAATQFAQRLRLDAERRTRRARAGKIWTIDQYSAWRPSRRRARPGAVTLLPAVR